MLAAASHCPSSRSPSAMSIALGISLVANALLFAGFTQIGDSWLSAAPHTVARTTAVTQIPTFARHGYGSRNTACSATTGAEDRFPAPRRNVMQSGMMLAGAAAAGVMGPNAAMAKGVKGFQVHKDTGDRYEFLYPFGWEEIYVKGTDILFKDIIEPLETASVTVIQTEKTSIKEYGDLADVTTSLAEKVLTPPGQAVKMVNAKEKEENGKTYYVFEFTAQNPRYVRHSLVSAAIDNGKYFIFVTGANQKRWDIMGPKLQKVAESFKLV